ncbi:GNAT family N-acetyltransferase [Georgenia yuyongxinii]|uniref:GNAT family N-acetyltransferase n=1 Tax=Georgenia yuyongxinii TaxID=2589797 RepID=UPI001E5EC433|nr:GNAT family N-acetyltransferase [Georgenia yuyongxinii]
MTSGDALSPDDDLLGRLLDDAAGDAEGPAGADPRAGHEHGDPHAGHAHADPLRPTADLSVRPALPEDAPFLGSIQARTFKASLTAAVGDLPSEVADAIDPVALGQFWAAAITSPPTPRHRVLTAVAGAQVVGFAAFAPAEVAVEVTYTLEEPDAGSGASDAERDGTAVVAEILALEVPAAHARRGHGSRLLAACADLLRDQGATRVQTWTVQDDESRTRFLSQAGFAPAGLRRVLDVGGSQVTEICWYADL